MAEDRTSNNNRSAEALVRAGRALVLGLDVNGLGVLRSLARAGVAADVLVDDMAHATARTRYGNLIGCPGLSGAQLMAQLKHYRARTDGEIVLFPTKELSVETIATHLSELRAMFRIPMPAPDIVAALTNKDRVVEIARAAEVDFPKSVTLRSDADLARLDGLRFPVVIKPAFHAAEYSASFKKAYVVVEKEDAAALLRRIFAVHREIIAQEWVEGDDEAIFFCLQYIDAQGRVRASFTGRKIASWPPRVGGTAACVPAPDAHDVLNGLTSRFFGAAQFHGLGSVEYKRDARDGRYYMIEPTAGRTDYQSEIATLNGVNIPYAAFCAELGLAVPRFTARVDSGWYDESAVLSGAKIPSHSKASRPIRLAGAYFRLSDPVPWAALHTTRVKRRLTRFLESFGSNDRD